MPERGGVELEGREAILAAAAFCPIFESKRVADAYDIGAGVTDDQQPSRFPEERDMTRRVPRGVWTTFSPPASGRFAPSSRCRSMVIGVTRSFGLKKILKPIF